MILPGGPLGIIIAYEKDGQRRASAVEGFYLYCVRKSGGSSSPFLTKGIDARGQVFALAFGDLEAVVSRVSGELAL